MRESITRGGVQKFDYLVHDPYQIMDTRLKNPLKRMEGTPKIREDGAQPNKGGRVKQCRGCREPVGDGSKFYPSFLAADNLLCKKCAIKDSRERRNEDIVHLLADRLYNAERRRRQRLQSRREDEDKEDEDDDDEDGKEEEEEEDVKKKKKHKTSPSPIPNFRVLAECVYRGWDGKSAISGSVKDPRNELCIARIDMDQEGYDKANYVLITREEARVLGRCRGAGARQALLVKLMAAR